MFISLNVSNKVVRGLKLDRLQCSPTPRKFLKVTTFVLDLLLAVGAITTGALLLSGFTPISLSLIGTIGAGCLIAGGLAIPTINVILALIQRCIQDKENKKPFSESLAHDSDDYLNAM